MPRTVVMTAAHYELHDRLLGLCMAAIDARTLSPQEVLALSALVTGEVSAMQGSLEGDRVKQTIVDNIEVGYQTRDAKNLRSRNCSW